MKHLFLVLGLFAISSLASAGELSETGKAVLAKIKALKEEEKSLLATITDEEQKDLVEEILDKEDADEDKKVIAELEKEQKEEVAKLKEEEKALTDATTRRGAFSSNAADRALQRGID
ncbi:unnamed protein product [Nippostrongylus brasiliensis]|uniref:Adhesion protein FadA n=1 Tax=Nippostrongylus brasiliensis TaxID=27835 RepID=A0A0N4XSB5_NIPBR|nr:unnamed protein product [Nippostrongylus brasiliensis]